ncbi:MAG: scyllo-inositol 2-dehydrogenase (NAD(+)) [Acidimicrobiia bacterium]|nr:MAG: scyllo-inositol 2-dehydrogenase (NAD(+)) [Acidimicrobiia bacterium]
MSEVGVLVVGVGRAGMVHARNFAAGVPGAHLVGVSDPNEEARQRAADELGCVAFADFETAVLDERVDAVVIASPTFTHASLAIRALEARKSVLSEKPLASSLEEAAAIAAAVNNSGAVFMIGFMRRFDLGFRRAAQLIEAGDIGEPLLVRSTTRGPGLPPSWAWDVERSGGLVAEVNSHDLDTVRWMTGQEYLTVTAVGRAAKRPDLAEQHPGFVDTLVVQCELDGGALAHIDGACPATYAYDARVEVYGSEGVVFAGSPVEGPLLVRKGQAHRDPVPGWAHLFAAAYRNEDAHFAAACRGEAVPIPGITDGIRALEAAVAINRSLREGRTVVVKELR